MTSDTLEASTEIKPKADYLLVQLTCEQVSSYWDQLAIGVEAGDEFPSYAKTNNILSAILAGRSQCWVIVRRTRERDRIVGMLTTTLCEDMVSQERSLFIGSLYGFDRIPDEGWRKALECLKKFARAQGLSKLTGLTKVPRVVEIWKLLGGNVEWTQLQMEI